MFMIYRLALVVVLMVGFCFHAVRAQLSCPTVAQDALTAGAQSLPLILVGNARIAAYAFMTLPVSPAGRNTVNVRARPSVETALVGSIPIAGTLMADGRTSDGKWLHVQLTEGGTGWVSASVIQVEGDASTLPTRDSDDTAFPSGAGFALTVNPDPNCPDASNGVLLQTPDGTDSLILNVDGILLDLDKATVFITDDAKGLGIFVLNGTLLVQANSQVIPIAAGMETHISRSADGRATGRPSDPVASDAAVTAQLPITQLGGTAESASASGDNQVAAPEAAILANAYQFAIDGSTPPICVSGDLSADEAAQEGQILTQNIPAWTSSVRYLQPGESMDVPVLNGGKQTVSALTNEQVITLTVVDFGRETLVAATLTAPGRYEF